MMKSLSIALVAATLAAASGCRWRGGESPEAADSSMAVLATASDIERAISTGDKELVLLHVWATWCAPCVKEFPHLVALKDFPPSANLDFIFVSADAAEDIEAVEKFVVSQGSPWKTYVVDNFNEEVMSVISSEWSGAIPATFFYDANGEILEWSEGMKTTDWFEEAITNLLDR